MKIETLGKIVLAVWLGFGATGGAIYGVKAGDWLKNEEYKRAKDDSKIDYRINYGGYEDSELAKKELIALNEKYKPGSMRDIGHKAGCGLVGLLIGTSIAGAFVCPPTLGGPSDDTDKSTPSGRDPFTGTPH